MIKEELDYDISRLTTFVLQARAARYVEYDGMGDLIELYKRGCFEKPWLHIGGGSNLLFVNGRYEGTVLHRRCRENPILLSEKLPESCLLSVCSSMPLDDLIRFTVSPYTNYYGLENLSGIPGEVGAGAVQNVGAYGVELGDYVDAIEAFDTHTGECIMLEAGELGYGYRTSRFKSGPDAGRFIVTTVWVRVSCVPKPVLTYGPLQELSPTSTSAQIRERVLHIRAAKLPAVDQYGSAGSFFKNPVVDEVTYRRAAEQSGLEIPYHITEGSHRKLSAAWLIDRCGLKGARVGGAAVWPLQPLVIYNAGGATGADVVGLESEITATVSSRFGIKLEPEVQHIY